MSITMLKKELKHTTIYKMHYKAITWTTISKMVYVPCGGNGYMDGEEEVYNDETDEYEEGTECDGFGRYGCDPR